MFDISKEEWIFRPQYVRRFQEMISSGKKMVHYTSAEAALAIISNASIWLRNTLLMNDATEINYGNHLMTDYFAVAREERREFWNVVDRLTGGSAEKLRNLYDGWVPDLSDQTFVCCVAEHLEEENDLGRLSMWRAYGRPTGVALVLNAHYLAMNATPLATYSYPVEYWTPAEAEYAFAELVWNVTKAEAHLATLSHDENYTWVFTALQTLALCIKHPAFKEEREWRVIHRPNSEASNLLKPRRVSIGGVPQRIFELPLVNNTDLGLQGISVADLIARVVIGPCEHSRPIAYAFIEALNEAGVPDADKKVWCSHVPFRG
jgi:hypothetical protein